ncbi:NAD-specific glutamate dehydrogenase [compost metagenome]
MQAVGKCRRGGFIDQAFNVQSSQLGRGPRGLALAIGKIRGDRNDRLGDRFAKVRLRVFLERAQDQR